MSKVCHVVWRLACETASILPRKRCCVKFCSFLAILDRAPKRDGQCRQMTGRQALLLPLEDNAQHRLVPVVGHLVGLGHLGVMESMRDQSLGLQKPVPATHCP